MKVVLQTFRRLIITVKISHKIVKCYSHFIPFGFIHTQYFIQKDNRPIPRRTDKATWQSGTLEQFFGFVRSVSVDKPSNPWSNIVVGFIGILRLECPTFFGTFSTAARVVAEGIS
jgi:hypothetical protein